MTPNTGHTADATPAPSVNRVAAQATIHCLTGCAIGEVLGLVIATALGWHDLPSVVLAIVLAFAFGYGLTIRPLVGSGMTLGEAGRLAFASDTLSIATMELVDTGIVAARGSRGRSHGGLGCERRPGGGCAQTEGGRDRRDGPPGVGRLDRAGALQIAHGGFDDGAHR